MKIEIQIPKEKLRELFINLQTPEDIADLLEINYSTLVYHIYKIKPEDRYETFSIPKRSGQLRHISAPITNLKILQKKLNYILQQVYLPRLSVHGFVFERGIVSNAEIHCQKKFVLNIDLLDFFPSINFGRVRGMFIKPPYNLPPKVATVLAQICCHDNQLPQGSPSSPIISNMLCARMDSELQRLAGNYRCDYSRYADDITFSTSSRVFPNQLCSSIVDSGRKIDIVGRELEEIVHNNGFQINTNKVRLQQSTCRQSVTGLITNQFPNTKRKFIKQIRSMLYDWDKYGLDSSQNKLTIKYKKLSSFKKVLKGKIEFLGMVRGRNEALYQRYITAFNTLDPNYIPPEPGAISVPMKHDAFISHASEDKNDFVEPLVELLKKQGQRIWYDKFCIEDGGGIPLSINEGIAESKYGIVVFSKSYFKKPWPKRELEALTIRDIYLGKKILFIWYKISVIEMALQAPLWAPRAAYIFPKENINQISNRLVHQLKLKAV